MDSFNQDDIKFKKTSEYSLSNKDKVKKEEPKKPGSLWNEDNKVKTDKSSVFGENDTEDNELDFAFNSDGKVDEDEAEVFNMYKKIEKKEIKIDGNWGDLTKIKELTKKDFDIDGDGKVSKEELKEVFEFLTVKSNKEVKPEKSDEKTSEKQITSETDYQKLAKNENEIINRLMELKAKYSKTADMKDLIAYKTEETKLKDALKALLENTIKPHDYSDAHIKGDFDERKARIADIYINMKLHFKDMIENAKTKPLKANYKKMENTYFEKLSEFYKNYSTYMKDEYEDKIKFFEGAYPTDREKQKETIALMDRENIDLKNICQNDENKINYLKKMKSFLKTDGGSAQYDVMQRRDLYRTFEVMIQEGKSLDEVDKKFKEISGVSLNKLDLENKDVWRIVNSYLKQKHGLGERFFNQSVDFKNIGIENPLNIITTTFDATGTMERCGQYYEILSVTLKLAEQNGNQLPEEAKQLKEQLEAQKKEFEEVYKAYTEIKDLDFEGKVLYCYEKRLENYQKRNFAQNELQDENFIPDFAKKVEELKKAKEENNSGKFWETVGKISNKPVNKEEIEKLISSYKEFFNKHENRENYTQTENVTELIPIQKRLSALLGIFGEDKFVKDIQTKAKSNMVKEKLDSLCEKYGDFKEILKKDKEEENKVKKHASRRKLEGLAGKYEKRRTNTQFLRNNLSKMRDEIAKNPDKVLDKEFLDNLAKIEFIDKNRDGIYYKKESKKLEEYGIDIDKPFVMTHELRQKIHDKGNIGGIEGFANHAAEGIPFIGALPSIEKSVNLMNIADKLKENNNDVMKLSRDERKTLYTFFVELEEGNLRDTTIGGNIGSGLPGSIAFLIEMGATMGVLGISEATTKTAAETVVQKGMELTAKNVLKAGLGNITRQLPKVLWTTTAMPQRYIGFALNRQYKANVNEKNQMVVERTDENFGKSLALGYLDTMIEVGTEFLVGEFAKTMTDAASVGTFGRTFKVPLLDKLYNNPVARTIGLHGLHEELLEEYAGNLLKAALGMEGDKDKPWLKNVIDSVWLNKKDFFSLVGSIVAQPIVISPVVYVQGKFAKHQVQEMVKNMPAQILCTLQLQDVNQNALDILNKLPNEGYDEVKSLMKEGKNQEALKLYQKQNLEGIWDFLQSAKEEFGINENNSEDFLVATNLLKKLLGKEKEGTSTQPQQSVDNQKSTENSAQERLEKLWAQAKITLGEMAQKTAPILNNFGPALPAVTPLLGLASTAFNQMSFAFIPAEVSSSEDIMAELDYMYEEMLDEENKALFKETIDKLKSHLFDTNVRILGNDFISELTKQFEDDNVDINSPEIQTIKNKLEKIIERRTQLDKLSDEELQQQYDAVTNEFYELHKNIWKVAEKTSDRINKVCTNEQGKLSLADAIIMFEDKIASKKGTSSTQATKEVQESSTNTSQQQTEETAKAQAEATPAQQAETPAQQAEGTPAQQAEENQAETDVEEAEEQTSYIHISNLMKNITIEDILKYQEENPNSKIEDISEYLGVTKFSIQRTLNKYYHNNIGNFIAEKGWANEKISINTDEDITKVSEIIKYLRFEKNIPVKYINSYFKIYFKIKGEKWNSILIEQLLSKKGWEDAKLKSDSDPAYAAEIINYLLSEDIPQSTIQKYFDFNSNSGWENCLRKWGIKPDTKVAEKAAAATPVPQTTEEQAKTDVEKAENHIDPATGAFVPPINVDSKSQEELSTNSKGSTVEGAEKTAEQAATTPAEEETIPAEKTNENIENNETNATSNVVEPPVLNAKKGVLLDKETVQAFCTLDAKLKSLIKKANGFNEEEKQLMMEVYEAICSLPVESKDDADFKKYLYNRAINSLKHGKSIVYLAQQMSNLKNLIGADKKLEKLVNEKLQTMQDCYEKDMLEEIYAIISNFTVESCESFRLKKEAYKYAIQILENQELSKENIENLYQEINHSIYLVRLDSILATAIENIYNIELKQLEDYSARKEIGKSPFNHYQQFLDEKQTIINETPGAVLSIDNLPYLCSILHSKLDYLLVENLQDYSIHDIAIEVFEQEYQAQLEQLEALCENEEVFAAYKKAIEDNIQNTNSENDIKTYKKKCQRAATYIAKQVMAKKQASYDTAQTEDTSKKQEPQTPVKKGSSVEQAAENQDEKTLLEEELKKDALLPPEEAGDNSPADVSDKKLENESIDEGKPHQENSLQNEDNATDLVKFGVLFRQFSHNSLQKAFNQAGSITRFAQINRCSWDTAHRLLMAHHIKDANGNTYEAKISSDTNEALEKVGRGKTMKEYLIYALKDQKLAAQDIQRNLKIDSKTYYDLLAQYGLFQGRIEIFPEFVYSLSYHGYNERDIGEKLGIDPKTVRSKLKEYHELVQKGEADETRKAVFEGDIREKDNNLKALRERRNTLAETLKEINEKKYNSIDRILTPTLEEQSDIAGDVLADLDRRKQAIEAIDNAYIEELEKALKEIENKAKINSQVQELEQKYTDFGIQALLANGTPIETIARENNVSEEAVQSMFDAYKKRQQAEAARQAEEAKQAEKAKQAEAEKQNPYTPPVTEDIILDLIKYQQKTKFEIMDELGLTTEEEYNQLLEYYGIKNRYDNNIGLVCKGILKINADKIKTENPELAEKYLSTNPSEEALSLLHNYGIEYSRMKSLYQLDAEDWAKYMASIGKDSNGNEFIPTLSKEEITALFDKYETQYELLDELHVEKNIYVQHLYFYNIEDPYTRPTNFDLRLFPERYENAKKRMEQQSLVTQAKAEERANAEKETIKRILTENGFETEEEPTKEALQILINNNTTFKAIQAYYGISNDYLQGLIGALDIRDNNNRPLFELPKKSNGEYITKEDLDKIKPITIEKLKEKFNISITPTDFKRLIGYYLGIDGLKAKYDKTSNNETQANIEETTQLPEKIRKITKDQLIDFIAQGLSGKQICILLTLEKDEYKALMEKYNLENDNDTNTQKSIVRLLIANELEPEEGPTKKSLEVLIKYGITLDAIKSYYGIINENYFQGLIGALDIKDANGNPLLILPIDKKTNKPLTKEDIEELNKKYKENGIISELNKRCFAAERNGSLQRWTAVDVKRLLGYALGVYELKKKYDKNIRNPQLSELRQQHLELSKQLREKSKTDFIDVITELHKLRPATKMTLEEEIQWNKTAIKMLQEKLGIDTNEPSDQTLSGIYDNNPELDALRKQRLNLNNQFQEILKNHPELGYLEKEVTEAFNLKPDTTSIESLTKWNNLIISKLNKQLQEAQRTIDDKKKADTATTTAEEAPKNVAEKPAAEKAKADVENPDTAPAITPEEKINEIKLKYGENIITYLKDVLSTDINIKNYQLEFIKLILEKNRNFNIQLLHNLINTFSDENVIKSALDLVKKDKLTPNDLDKLLKNISQNRELAQKQLKWLNEQIDNEKALGSEYKNFLIDVLKTGKNPYEIQTEDTPAPKDAKQAITATPAQQATNTPTEEEKNLQEMIDKNNFDCRKLADILYSFIVVNITNNDHLIYEIHALFEEILVKNTNIYNVNQEETDFKDKMKALCQMMIDNDPNDSSLADLKKYFEDILEQRYKALQNIPDEALLREIENLKAKMSTDSKINEILGRLKEIYRQNQTLENLKSHAIDLFKILDKKRIGILNEKDENKLEKLSKIRVNSNNNANNNNANNNVDPQTQFTEHIDALRTATAANPTLQEAITNFRDDITNLLQDLDNNTRNNYLRSINNYFDTRNQGLIAKKATSDAQAKMNDIIADFPNEVFFNLTEFLDKTGLNTANTTEKAIIDFFIDDLYMKFSTIAVGTYRNESNNATMTNYIIIPPNCKKVLKRKDLIEGFQQYENGEYEDVTTIQGYNKRPSDDLCELKRAQETPDRIYGRKEKSYFKMFTFRKKH